MLGKVVFDGAPSSSETKAAGSDKYAGAAVTVSSPFLDPNERNLVAEVSRTKPELFEAPASATAAPLADSKLPPASPSSALKPVKIIAVDCGIKNNIIRYLANKPGVQLKVCWALALF